MDQLHHGHEMMMRRPSTTTGHDAALRFVQKPPAKPWRAGTGLAPTPPRVYRVEPSEFRDLVQRLTGAPTAPRQTQRAAVAPIQPVALRIGSEELASAPWCPFPLMPAPAGMHPELDGHQLT